MEKARQIMIDIQLRKRGIRDENVLSSMMQVPRHLFVPPMFENSAYSDSPLPIGNGQTISQPYIVAFMTQCADLKKTDKVLEIGTGCGYAAAVISHIVDAVHTVETIQPLAEASKRRLRELGYSNVHVHHGDGSRGLPEFAPYDAIIVTASGPEIPKSYLKQLIVGGRLVMPVQKGQGMLATEQLVKVTKRDGNHYDEENLVEVRFVPLVGEEGWN